MDTDTLKLKLFTGVMRKFEFNIAIRHNGSFGLSSAFLREENLEKFTHVELWYDAAAMIVALKFLAEASDACFKLITCGSERSPGIAISGTSFFKGNRLNAARLKGKYVPTKAHIDGVGDVYLIQLDKKNL